MPLKTTAAFQDTFLSSVLFFYFLNFWLHWVFVTVFRLPLVAASRGYSSLWCAGFSLRWLLLLWSTGSRCMGFSSCDTWAQQLWLMGSRAQAQQLWHMGLVALRHVGSSWTRAQTHVPCLGRWILNHCTTGEALYFQIFKETPYCSPQWLYQFIFPPKVQETSLFSTSSPAFIFCRLFDDSHSDWCEVIPHCSFDLHFSNNQ